SGAGRPFDRDERPARRGDRRLRVQHLRFGDGTGSQGRKPTAPRSARGHISSCRYPQATVRLGLPCLGNEIMLYRASAAASRGSTSPSDGSALRIAARPLRSIELSTFLVMIGRGIRPQCGKPSLLVYLIPGVYYPWRASRDKARTN